MIAPGLLFRDVVDDHGLLALPDFVTDRGLDLQFATRLQSEVDFIKHATGDPTILGHPGNAANRIPVVRHTTSRIVGTASMRLTLSTSP